MSSISVTFGRIGGLPIPGNFYHEATVVDQAGSVTVTQVGPDPVKKAQASFFDEAKQVISGIGQPLGNFVVSTTPVEPGNEQLSLPSYKVLQSNNIDDIAAVMSFNAEKSRPLVLLTI